MSKRVEIMEKLKSLMVGIVNQQDSKKILDFDLKNDKKEVINILDKLGMDEYAFSDPEDKLKKVKALKYDAIKLEIKEDQEEKFIEFLEMSDLENVVERKVNLKTLEEEFEKGNISISEVKKFVSYKRTSNFKVQKVKK